MKNGDVMCNDICNYLVNLDNNHKICNSNDCVSNDELVTTCRDHGNLLCLFEFFLLLSIKRGTLDEDSIKTYSVHL